MNVRANTTRNTTRMSMSMSMSMGMGMGMVLSVLMTLQLSVTLGREALGASRTPYGGQLKVFMATEPSAIELDELDSAYALAVASLVYEPLYRLRDDATLEPVLAAGPPEIANDGYKVIIPLKPPQPAHDGRRLSAEEIRRALEALASSESSAAFAFLPVRGGRARIAGHRAALSIKVRKDRKGEGPGLVFGLATPYAAFPMLLAVPQLLVEGPTPGVGTGPFRRATTTPTAMREREAWTLLSFLQHRDGRPFLDSMVITPVASRFATTSLVEQRRAHIVLGVPERAPQDVPLLTWPRGPAPQELTTLSIGAGETPSRSLSASDLAQIDGAIHRARIIGRHLGQAARATRTLLGTAEPRAEAQADTRPNTRTETQSTHRGTDSASSRRPPSRPANNEGPWILLVPKDARFGQRLAERVQLDLVRAGISAKITRISRDEARARRRQRNFDLLLDTDYSTSSSEAPMVIRFHGLLQLAVSHGCPDAVDDASIRAFDQATEAQRAVLVGEIDQRIRETCRMIAIATSSPGIFIRSDVTPTTVDGGGRIAFENVTTAGPP
ncbi:MAG: hypothetical protein H6729_17050 [Deltaproteobacteria bacterium]|nr:hypothetical protein [Deltaproteobacteria bacterium]